MKLYLSNKFNLNSNSNVNKKKKKKLCEVNHEHYKNNADPKFLFIIYYYYYFFLKLSRCMSYSYIIFFSSALENNQGPHPSLSEIWLLMVISREYIIGIGCGGCCLVGSFYLALSIDLHVHDIHPLYINSHRIKLQYMSSKKHYSIFFIPEW